MKKSLRIALALCLIAAVCIGLTACGSKGIVGTWKVQTMAAQGVTVNLKEMGGSMTFTFKADGKGTLTENMSGSTDTEEFTYSTANGKITITSNGESKSFDYKLSGKTLIMDMEIEEGQVVKLTMTK